MSLSDKEPAPEKSDSIPSWELVKADIDERDKFGEEKYGVRLQAGNGRNALVDSYQEALDLTVYLRTLIEEMRAAGAELRSLQADMFNHWIKDGDEDEMVLVDRIDALFAKYPFLSR